MFQDEQDTKKNQETMGCALKVQSILGKGFLKIKCMVERIIFVFILSILQHPVNPVRVLIF